MSNSPPASWFPAAQNSLNSRILATAILSLVFVISLFVAIHFYVRCVLRRRHLEHRRRTIPSTFLHILSSTNGVDPPPPPTGLDPAAIAALPTFTYRSSDDDTASSAECTVCLSPVEEGETLRLLPSCKHVFHVDCIDMWLRSHSTCPVCRATAEAPVPPPVAAVAEGTAPPMCEGCERAQGAKEGSSSSSTSRLSSSFRRMLSRGASGRRGGQGAGVEDLERQ